MSGSTSMISLLRNPRDPSWQYGSHRSHHLVLLYKTFCTFILIGLEIVEYPLYVHSSPNKGSDGALLFWWRLGIALVPDLVYTFIAFALIFQIPKIVIRSRTWTFHPVFALVFSIILLGLYITVSFFNTLSAYSLEVYPLPDYATVWLAQVAFEALSALAYIVMMVLASIAVHRRRMREDLVQITADRVIELLDRREHGKTNG